MNGALDLGTSFAEGKDEDSLPAVSPTRYERLELIGSGAFGEVYRGWDREEGLEVAIKVIDLEIVMMQESPAKRVWISLSEDDITDIHKEVAMLAQCRSSNITEYYASVMLPGTTELLIVMELMATSVSDLLDGERSCLDERSIAYILREVLKALIYLHTGHRIHRDVKSANVLLSAHGEVKISDFGVSGQLSKTVAFKRKTFVGSPFWMAPEVISANTNDDGYTETADIWSLGITAYEMATGRPPHADLHPMRALFLIPAQDSPRLEGPFSQEFKSFIAQCLQKDPRLRPSANTLIHHPFLSGPHDSGKLAELVQFQADQKRNAGGGGARPPAESHSRLPASKWDFDSLGRAARAQRAAKGTIKSHQINNFTMRDSTWGSTYAPGRLQSWGEGIEQDSRSPSLEGTVSPSDAGSLEHFHNSPFKGTDSPANPSASLDRLPDASAPSQLPPSPKAGLETIPEDKSIRPELRQDAASELSHQSSSPGGGWLAGLWNGRREDSSRLKGTTQNSHPESHQPTEHTQTIRHIPDGAGPSTGAQTFGYGNTVQDSGTVRYISAPRENDIQGTVRIQHDHEELPQPAFLHAAQNKTLAAMLQPASSDSSHHLDLRELLFGTTSGAETLEPKLQLPKPNMDIVELLQDSEGSTSLSPLQAVTSPGFEQPGNGNNEALGALGNFLMARWRASASLLQEQAAAGQA